MQFSPAWSVIWIDEPELQYANEIFVICGQLPLRLPEPLQSPQRLSELLVRLFEALWGSMGSSGSFGCSAWADGQKHGQKDIKIILHLLDIIIYCPKRVASMYIDWKTQRESNGPTGWFSGQTQNHSFLLQSPFADDIAVILSWTYEINFSDTTPKCDSQ